MSGGCPEGAEPQGEPREDLVALVAAVAAFAAHGAAGGPVGVRAVRAAAVPAPEGGVDTPVRGAAGDGPTPWALAGRLEQVAARRSAVRQLPARRS